MHGCVETALSCYYFYVCALGWQVPSIQSVSTFSGQKSPDRKKALCDSSRKEEIFFCQATAVLVLQNQKLPLPKVFLLQLRENFALLAYHIFVGQCLGVINVVSQQVTCRKHLFT